MNSRHKDVHYRLIAQAIAALVRARGRVLDYGSGEAPHADIAAATAGELLLCEAAPGVRAGLETSHSRARMTFFAWPAESALTS